MISRDTVSIRGGNSVVVPDGNYSVITNDDGSFLLTVDPAVVEDGVFLGSNSADMKILKAVNYAIGLTSKQNNNKIYISAENARLAFGLNSSKVIDVIRNVFVMSEDTMDAILRQQSSIDTGSIDIARRCAFDALTKNGRVAEYSIAINTVDSGFLPDHVYVVASNHLLALNAEDLIGQFGYTSEMHDLLLSISLD